MEPLYLVWSYYRAVVRSSIKDDRGASVIEYALLVSLIAAFCIAGITMVGNASSASLGNSASKLP